MSFSYTIDEKSTGYYSLNAYDYRDALGSIYTTFSIAEGVWNAAYGLLDNVGYIADVDAYSMGILSPGTYSVSASGYSWFYGSPYYPIYTPTVGVYNSSGILVAGGSSSSTSFTISSSGTYFIGVTGLTYSSSQYSLSYTYSPPINYPANNGSVTISGDLVVGNTISISGTFTDLNGLDTANSTNGYLCIWYVSSDGFNWTEVSRSTNASYIIQASDEGKYIDCIISFIDDDGNYESVSPSRLLIPSPVDSTPPTIAIGTSDNNLTTGETAIITFTLSEASTNFVSGDVTVTGGTLSGFTGSGTTYTATFTPDADSTTNGVVSVASTKFTDAAGNANSDGSDGNNRVTMTVNTVAVDSTPPTIAIETSDSSLTTGETATITFTLSESSANFTLDDVTVSGGALSGFTGSGTIYTATFTPDVDSTTNGVVSVASGKFTDAISNANEDGSDGNNRVTMSVNTILPTSTKPDFSAAINLTIFDEKVPTSLSTNTDYIIPVAANNIGQVQADALINFYINDILVLSVNFNLMPIDDTGYTATGYDFMPAQAGIYTFRWVLDETNLVAEENESNNVVTKTVVVGGVDVTPPSIVITSNVSSLSIGETAVIRFVLSEPYTNFVSSDIMVSGGTLANFSGSGTTYEAIFTPTPNSTTPALIGVASGSFSDPAGNTNADGADGNNTVTMAVNTVAVDSTPPTIAITTSDNNLTTGESATITFTLSEASTNFVSGDVTVTGGTLSGFTGSGTTYTATFTPDADSTTNGVVSVASTKFTDAAGNANADGSDGNNRVTMTVNTVGGVDAVAPTVDSFSPSISSSQASIGTNIVITFDEAVQLGAGLITLRSGSSNGTIIEQFDVSNTSRVTVSDLQVTINPSTNLNHNTTYYVTIESGAIVDLSGNEYLGTTAYNFRTAVMANVLNGNSSNDQIINTLRDDAIDGGSGIDTVSYSLSRTNYEIGVSGSGYTVHALSSAEGLDTLVNVEKLQFDDMTVDLTMRAQAQTVTPLELQTLQELYVGFFNRVPEANGLSYWISEINDGATLRQVADQFYSAGVQFGVYSANMTEAQFITTVYANVLGRTGASAPDNSEIAYWQNWLNTGSNSKGAMVLQMLNDSHNFFTNDPVVGWVIDLLDNKAAVANYFAVEQGISYNTPEESIARGIEIAAAITPTDITDAITLIGIADEIV